MTGLRQLLRAAWAIAGPYWGSEERWAARGLLLVVVALNLGMVSITVLLNQWTNRHCQTKRVACTISARCGILVA